MAPHYTSLTLSQQQQFHRGSYMYIHVCSSVAFASLDNHDTIKYIYYY